MFLCVFIPAANTDVGFSIDDHLAAQGRIRASGRESNIADSVSAHHAVKSSVSSRFSQPSWGRS